MRVLTSLFTLLVPLTASVAHAASPWSFSDATVSVQGKGAGVGNGLKEKLTAGTPLSKPITLGAGDSLKVILTTTDGTEAKRPHQAFLTLREEDTGLEESFPFNVKEIGKAKVELTQKDLPGQLLTSSKPLKAALVIASFGSSTPYNSKAFDLDVKLDPNVLVAVPEKPLRYGKREHIHHTFRADPRSPPKIISLIFTAAVLAALPLLLVGWLMLGANVNHAKNAFSDAPISHALFIGSIIALEEVFFLYYTRWNLFQTLPVAAAVGLVAFLSGSRALSEVQERRLAGLR